LDDLFKGETYFTVIRSHFKWTIIVLIIITIVVFVSVDIVGGIATDVHIIVGDVIAINVDVVIIIVVGDIAIDHIIVVDAAAVALLLLLVMLLLLMLTLLILGTKVCRREIAIYRAVALQGMSTGSNTLTSKTVMASVWPTSKCSSSWT
jgi:hypothetical protein